RMRTTAVLEAFNVGWLALLLFVVAGVPASVSNLAGYAVLGILLLEGAAYWALKYRQLRSGARCPSGMVTFRFLRLANVAMLASGLVVLVVAAALSPGLATWPGRPFWACAVPDHVNYFRVPWSHHPRADMRRLARTRRLRAARLAVDLARCRT